MYPFLLTLVLMLMPWKPEYYHAVLRLEIIHEQYPCDHGAWIGPDQIIHLCPAPGDRWDWLALHESQHIMASTYLPPNMSFGNFAYVAMKSLREGDYTDEQIRQAEYYLTYGEHELHAGLPWITGGRLPPSVQYWYPWFDLTSWVSAS